MLIIRLHLKLGQVGVPIEPVLLARIVITVHVATSFGHLHHLLLLIGFYVTIGLCNPVRVGFYQFLPLNGTASDPKGIIDLSLS